MSLTKYIYNIPENPKQLFIFIHGYGANGGDLLNLSGFFSDILKDCIFLAPDAPHINPYLNNSFYWFELETLEDNYLDSQVDKATPTLDKFIKEIQEEYNISNKNTHLFGFSQGALFALQYGLRAKESFASIIASSGGCLYSKLDPKSLNKTPICLIHGELDDVITPDHSTESYKFLKEHLPICECHILKNTHHEINIQGLNKVKEFLEKISANFEDAA